MRVMLKSKVHRATVTDANLEYEGSITIDRELMDRADLLPGEKVLVADLTNGARVERYVIEGKRHSGVICINGAAAHLIKKGDVVIIMAFGFMNDEEARTMPAKKVRVDKNNKVVRDDSGFEDRR